MADSTSSPPRRILQLVTEDKLGGVRTLMHMVEAGLRERGYEVETMALHSGSGAASAVREMAQVAHAILSDRYDCIFTYQAAASVFGGFMGWLRRRPLRVPHQTAAPEGIPPHWRMLDKLFGATGVYTHLISNSRATSEQFACWPAAYRGRFVLIPHGVNPIPAPAGTLSWRARLGIPEGRLVLLATGRLVDQKNHAVAIEALALLPEAHLIIAGDGPNGARLEKLARRLDVAGRVHLIGPIDRLALGDVFAAADIYLFPSVWETFGLAGVEAAMAGLPIVASDLPVLREVLDITGPSGAAAMVRFHEPGSAAALARAVTATMAAYPTLSERAAFAECHRLRHSRERMLQLYEDFLTRAMAR